MEKPRNKLFKNLEGLTFGKLKVLKYAGTATPNRIKKKGHQWQCQCECGNKKIILGDSLRNGNTISCGCFQKKQTSKAKKIDLTGRKFGKLKVVNFAYIKKTQTFWLCKCECGNTKAINGASLKRGASKSCGCKQGRFIHGMWGKPGYKAHYLKDPVKKIRHTVSVSVRNSLTRKNNQKGGRTFDYLPYTPKELKEHLESQFEDWMSWENYGGANDDPKKTWHIDHIKPHSKFPYKSLDDPLFQKCWALSNLRPLEKIRNMREGARA